VIRLDEGDMVKDAVVLVPPGETPDAVEPGSAPPDAGPSETTPDEEASESSDDPGTDGDEPEDDDEASPESG